MNRSRNVLIVDPDAAHCARLGRELVRHDFEVYVAHDGATGLEIARDYPLAHAVVELQLPGHSGLRVLAELMAVEERLKVVILATHPSIATAVEAIKLGATQYLPKPVHAREVIGALDPTCANDGTLVVRHQLSLKAIMWEHIERSLAENGGNVSAAARALGMHRRTLQRRLRQRTRGAGGGRPPGA